MFNTQSVFDGRRYAKIILFKTCFSGAAVVMFKQLELVFLKRSRGLTNDANKPPNAGLIFRFCVCGFFFFFSFSENNY